MRPGRGLPRMGFAGNTAVYALQGKRHIDPETGNASMLAGRMHAAPTMQNKHHTNRKRLAAVFYHTVNLIFSRGVAASPLRAKSRLRRLRSETRLRAQHLHFSFLFFNF